MTTTTPLLRVQGLRVEIPTRRGLLLALDDISFQIAPGEILGFVGESGAGKSLTGMAILGLGVPPTSPSLGTLIRVGNEVLFSGEWWVTVMPGALLIVLVLAINLLGDWLRDVFNPKLK